MHRQQDDKTDENKPIVEQATKKAVGEAVKELNKNNKDESS